MPISAGAQPIQGKYTDYTVASYSGGGRWQYISVAAIDTNLSVSIAIPLK